MKAFDRVLLALCLSLAAALLLAGAANLPERVPSGFNGQGEARGYTSKSSFLLLQAGLMLGLPLSMVALGRWLRGLPDSAFNLPHRDFWLSPDQREGTLDALQTWLLRFACGLCVFLGTMYALSWYATTQDPVKLPGGSLAVATWVFLVFSGAMAWALIRRFKNLPLHTLDQRPLPRTKSHRTRR